MAAVLYAKKRSCQGILPGHHDAERYRTRHISGKVAVCNVYCHTTIVVLVVYGACPHLASVVFIVSDAGQRSLSVSIDIHIAADLTGAQDFMLRTVVTYLSHDTSPNVIITMAVNVTVLITAVVYCYGTNVARGKYPEKGYSLQFQEIFPTDSMDFSNYWNKERHLTTMRR